jgi:hypothetical protein
VGVVANCPAITAKGSPCQGYVHPSKEYCPAHCPDRAEARKKAASKAGRAKPGSELHALKQKLIQLGDDVLAGKADKGKASVVAQVWGVAVRAIEAEVKVRELEQIQLPQFERLDQEVSELKAMIEEKSVTRRSPWAG